MANNQKKYASLTTLQNLVSNIKSLFATKADVNAELAKKADSSHTHTIANVTNLQSTLDAKVPTSRTVNGKALTTNITLSASDVGAAPATHDHNDTYYQKTEVDTKLSGKANSSHTHTIANVTNLQSTLDGKSNTGHNHTTHSQATMSNTDLNTIKTAGWYYGYTGMTNAPVQNIAVMEVLVYSPDWIVQRFTVVNGAEYIRHWHSATTWSEWKTEIDSGNIGSQSVKSATKATQDGNGKVISSTYETKTDATSKLTEAKTYADNAANAVKNDLLNNAGAAYDTLKELGDLIDDNKDAIDALETVASGKANAVHSHAISDVSGLQSALDGKAASSHGTHVSFDSTNKPKMDGTAAFGTSSKVARADHVHPTDTSRASKTEFDSHNSDTTKHITSTERTNWNNAKTLAENALPTSGGTMTGAITATQTNIIKRDVDNGGVTVLGGTEFSNSASLGLYGKNQSAYPGYFRLTADDDNDIAILEGRPDGMLTWDSKTVLTATGGVLPVNNGGTGASTPSKALQNLGITATATELNYMDGVTSNVQAQLDSKAESSHKHSGSDITSGTVAAARLPVASDSTAGIVNTTTQSFKGNKTFTGTVTVNNLAAGADTSSIGNSLNPFDDAYINTLHIGSTLNNGSVSNGGVFKLSKVGTTTTSGVATLQLGNNVASGSAGNAYGTIEIYNENTGSVTIRTSHEDSRNIYIDLPENGGMLLTDDDLSEYSKTGHTHSASSITSGILPVEYGGTGNSNGYVRAGAEAGSTIGALATAEGRKVTASGNYSHAEGNYTEASGSSSHAEGQSSTASGIASHAEGNNATASGSYSHAEGDFTNSSAKGAHAEGTYTLASSDYQHVQGKFNIEDKSGVYAHIVGNGTGTSNSSRSNAHTIDWDGNGWFQGDIYVGGESQDDTSASKVITTADQRWNLLYDSGEISAIANSISNIDVSGYTNIQVLVRCYNDGDSINSRAGSAIFTCTNGKTYQFPVWSNMFSKSINTVYTMATFNLVDGWLVCPYASRLIGDANTFEDEGGTAGNLSLTGSGMMKCTSQLSTLTISNLDQNSNYYFGMGSRVMVWGWNA